MILVPYKYSNVFEAVGLAHHILYESDQSKGVSFQYIHSAISIPAMLGNITFLKGIDSKPLAYFSWGFFSHEISLVFSRGGKLQLDIYDWNDGSNLWVYEVVSSRVMPLALIKYLSIVFKGQRVNFFYQNKHYYLINGKINKELI